MRDRLVATFVGLTLLLLALFVVPAAYVVADVVQDQEQARADRTASLVAAALDDHLDAGGTVDRDYLETLLEPGERLVYAAPDGRRTAAGSADDARLQATSPVAAGGSVTLSRSQQSVADQVSEDVLPLAALALVLAAASGVLGVWVARRFSRPFGELSDVAAAIGAGRFATPVPRFGVPEADELGRTLRDTAARLDVLVHRERSLAVAASHELRTPLTALRLSLEDLSLWKQVPADVAAELTRAIGEVDRLSAAVADLLEGRREEVSLEQVDVDLTALVVEVAGPWRERLAERGRRLVLRPSRPLTARLEPDALRRVLDALLSHATVHGRGTVTVDVSARRTTLRVGVADEGERRFHSGILHGDDPAAEAAGLAEAATTAEAAGGYLAAQDAPESRIVLVLPDRPATP